MRFLFITEFLNINNFIRWVNFSVFNLTYDANGNILTMNQNGLKINTSPLIDQFNYTYIPKTNKLKNVRDQVNEATSTLGDFKTSVLHPQNAAKAGAITLAARDAIIDYSYDANVNLTKDFNKDIATASGGEGIQYNHLNIPSIITIKKDASSIVYPVIWNFISFILCSSPLFMIRHMTQIIFIPIPNHKSETTCVLFLFLNKLTQYETNF